MCEVGLNVSTVCNSTKLSSSALPAHSRAAVVATFLENQAFKHLRDTHTQKKVRWGKTEAAANQMPVSDQEEKRRGEARLLGSSTSAGKQAAAIWVIL